MDSIINRPSRYDIIQVRMNKIASSFNNTMCRVLKQLESLQKLIDQFPDYNDHDVDLLALRDKMKNKLRVISSLLGVQQRYLNEEKPKMSY